MRWLMSKALAKKCTQFILFFSVVNVELPSLIY